MAFLANRPLYVLRGEQGKLFVLDREQVHIRAGKERRFCGKKSWFAMATPELEQLLESLRSWCSAGRGRQATLAKYLGVSRGRLNDWLSRKRTPTIQEFFEVRRFLSEHDDSRHPKDYSNN